ncbi:phospholipase/Carboxylesterase [Ktedonobacter racemifer DSM 44963]|uniref:Phospholipase/Carboxylesterase n=1 Tax=Ktedonobacter racemifer DSM 44963 TaxID=485913 RepID=D6TXT0_KTERA|nr:phospholipase/Carboxylesterase [Ktedonobacter racemifer DSM 44963]
MSSINNTNSEAMRERLTARPATPTNEKSAVSGLHPLRLKDTPSVLLYVPSNYRTTSPPPLVIMLHGAGGNARDGLTSFIPVADTAGFMLLAPSSRSRTWNAIMNTYNEDVRSIDKALTHIFTNYAIDPSHLAIGGFSDGASYALSLGLANGDLFTHIVAFSPGRLPQSSRHGKPLIYISHGTQDNILPIDLCSRRIVRQLQHDHYDVSYQEFDGPHTIPVEIAREAWAWFSASN